MKVWEIDLLIFFTECLLKLKGRRRTAAFKLQNKIAALRSENAELKETNLKQQTEIQLSEAIIKKVSASILLNKQQRQFRMLFGVLNLFVNA